MCVDGIHDDMVEEIILGGTSQGAGRSTGE